MKSREELRKSIKDLKETLEGYEIQIQKYRRHIDLLMRAAGRSDAKAVSQKLSTSEAGGKTAPNTPEVHETVASFIAKLTSETRLSQLAVKTVAKPSRGIKKEAMRSKLLVHSGTHAIDGGVKIE